MDRKEELKDILKDVDDKQKRLVNRLVDEVVYIEDTLSDLKKLPFMRVHPKDSTRQEITPAGKQYRDLTATYMNAIRILCSLISKTDTDDYDPVAEFLKKMKEEK